MAWFFASGHAIDVVLAVLGFELIYLIGARRTDMSSALLALLPGAMMVLAARAALTGADWPWVAAALAASLPVHLADLRRRRWL